jgi:acyl CoA:acetate/3-ketoacid CoA transferase alpha subunit
MVDFINGLQVDWTTDPPEVSLPAIIPPLAMKPVICSEYLDRWYECAQTIKKAKTIVIVGYSFGVSDEHINDLIRKGNKSTKLIVVDPGFDTVITRVCQIVGHDKNSLKGGSVQGFKCKAGGRLMFVKARAEEINSAKLIRILE